ncbi:MAG: PepSY-associated TM helix domain-containing protein [Burkholderiales bacterium]|nr:PepSY-associated TM helix domain-containing protein [Burkholderiales bacterium]
MERTRSDGRRAWWLRHLHRWHWISAAAALVGLLLFSVTGITLNHAADIEAHPQVLNREAQLPRPLLAQLEAAASAVGAATPQTKPSREPPKAPLPEPLRQWLKSELAVSAGSKQAEWADGEIYLPLPRPGGDAWVRIDLASGDVEYELTNRGWISYLNDLHKGRNTGTAWVWFIDIFAVACLVFAVTGLFILQMHAGNRPFTWPVAGLGLLVPVLLALLLIH